MKILPQDSIIVSATKGIPFSPFAKSTRQINVAMAIVAILLTFTALGTSFVSAQIIG